MPHSTVINDITLPLAPLETISYASVVAQDAQEIHRLLKACQYPGFFYLDFRDSDPDGEGRQILQGLKEAYKVTEKYIAEHSPPDKFKDIELRHDHLPPQTSPSLPKELQSSLPLLNRLSQLLREANIRLASQIYPSLISSNHSPSDPSETALDLIYAPTKPLEKDAPDTTHTDGGTITILCSDSWGSKLEDPKTKKWLWVEPREGCGLVNVGDWFDRESKKIDSENGERAGLHSCKHAVAQVGDGEVKRYYVSHYLRPALAN